MVLHTVCITRKCFSSHSILDRSEVMLLQLYPLFSYTLLLKLSQNVLNSSHKCQCCVLMYLIFQECRECRNALFTFALFFSPEICFDTWISLLCLPKTGVYRKTHEESVCRRGEGRFSSPCRKLWLSSPIPTRETCKHSHRAVKCKKTHLGVKEETLIKEAGRGVSWEDVWLSPCPTRISCFKVNANPWTVPDNVFVWVESMVKWANLLQERTILVLNLSQ